MCRGPVVGQPGFQSRPPRRGGGGVDTPGLVPRDDLVGRSDRAATRQVTIISAPAGRGKTSLLRAWSDRPDQAYYIASVQVRHNEPDAQLFWLAVLNAIRRASG